MLSKTAVCESLLNALCIRIKLEIRVSQNLAKLGEGALQNFSDGVGRDGFPGLTGEVELHGLNSPEI